MNKEINQEEKYSVNCLVKLVTKNVVFEDLPNIDIMPEVPWPPLTKSKQGDALATSKHYTIERLRQIFSSMDRNGHILVEELFALLRDNLQKIKLEFETVKIFLDIYDKELNDRVSFEEFVDIFLSLYKQYEAFVKYDVDVNGSIDSNELKMLFEARGFEFSGFFYDRAVAQNMEVSGCKSMSFDRFVRFMTKFELLRSKYEEKSHENSGVTLGDYIFA
jgi:Ca2+-binding EF-hand superfamily protein